MTGLDAGVLVAMGVGAFVGFRVGFLVRALSWLGLSIGIAVALYATPRLVRSLAGASPGTRLLAVASLLVGLALIGHTTGLVLSQTLRTRFATAGPISTVDRLTGGALGALGALALLWLLTPALRSTPGWPAREARTSSMVALVDRYAPPPPKSANLLGRIVSESPYPLLDNPAGVHTAAPSTDAGPRVDTRAARSVALVRGTACGLELSGTGFAIAPGLLLTNAHVVAGERATTITTSDGHTVDARVVMFDGRHDIAVLRSGGLDLPVLALGPTRLDAIASVLGHPRGGRLRATPARVVRWIDTPRSDIYRDGAITTRIVGLAAHLIPGDSGAPVVGTDGRVAAMVFAVDPADSGAAFALRSTEIAPFVRAAPRRVRAASTGGCLVG